MSVNWNTSFNEMYLDANRLNDAELNSFDTSTNSENGQSKFFIIFLFSILNDAKSSTLLLLFFVWEIFTDLI